MVFSIRIEEIFISILKLLKNFGHRNPWVKQKFSNAGETVTIAADGTETAALNIDGITGLDSDGVQDAWEGLVCEIWNEAETTKQAILLITDAVDAVVVVVVPLPLSLPFS